MPISNPDHGNRDGDGHGGHGSDAQTPLLKSSITSRRSLSREVTLLFQDWFLWEILSALTAILAVGLVIAILAVYDSRSLPDWPSVLTINSVISLLATIGKLSTAAAIGASISQSKWLWYRQRPRPLQDIQIFDNASRGPWGALVLLFTLGARNLASLGALITILMLLFDPFLQQVVVYPDRLIPSERPSTIIRAQHYEARSYEGLPLPALVDLSMKAAVYTGIFDVPDRASIETGHHCSTGKYAFRMQSHNPFSLTLDSCTWQDFSSLAVCSKCVDITAYIEKLCNSSGCYEHSLPGGPKILGFGGRINSTVTNISPDLYDIEPSILQFSTLIARGTHNSDDAVAWECSVSYCINIYSASVIDGEFQQEVKRSWRNNSAAHSQNSDLVYGPPVSFLNTTKNVPDFTVAALAATAINNFMSITFTGNGSIDNSTSRSAFSSDIVHALYKTEDLPKSIDNLAVSMSDNIRQQEDIEYSPFHGLAMKTETYVHVRWAWFAYPVVVLMLLFFYLAGTILETARRDVRVWKSSNLALIFHGRGLELDNTDRVPVITLSEMTAKAKEVEIELVQTDDDDWKLVQR